MYELTVAYITTHRTGVPDNAFCHYLDGKLVAIDFFLADDEMFEEEDRWYFSQFADQAKPVTDLEEIECIAELINVSKYDMENYHNESN